MSVIEKIKLILELSYKLNPTGTERSVTGDKPTAFVSFNGHIARLEVWIHENGWDGKEPYCYPSKYYNIKIENDDETDKLDEVISLLEKLIEEWG